MTIVLYTDNDRANASRQRRMYVTTCMADRTRAFIAFATHVRDCDIKFYDENNAVEFDLHALYRRTERFTVRCEVVACFVALRYDDLLAAKDDIVRYLGTVREISANASANFAEALRLYEAYAELDRHVEVLIGE